MMLNRIISIVFLVEFIAICSADFWPIKWFKPAKPNNTIGNLTYASQIKFETGVHGIEMMGKDLYVIRGTTPTLYALKQNLTTRLSVTYGEFKNPYDLASVNKDLFLLDWTEAGSFVYKIDVDCRYNITKWPYAGNFSSGSLSTTPDNNLLVVVRENGKILEFTPNGKLLRTVQTSAGAAVRHAIKLKNGKFAVASGTEPTDLHRVCVYTNLGTMGACFGNSVGDSISQLNNPWRLLEMRNGNILVADMMNRRVVELNQTLAYNRTLLDQTSGNGFNNPFRMFQTNGPARTFYVASNDFNSQLGYSTGGAVLAYNF